MGTVVDPEWTIKGAPYPWWQVDLGALHNIEKVVLYNRLDHYSNNLKDFSIEVLHLEGDREVVSRIYFENTVESIAIATFKERTEGQIIRVRLNGDTSLHLAEV